MLQEINNPRQHENEPQRRCFWSQNLSLTIWLELSDEITGFQLCYTKGLDKKAITWRKENGFQHQTVDEGETGPLRYKMTPILLSDGVFEKDSVAEIFSEASRNLDTGLRDFIIKILKSYPG